MSDKQGSKQSWDILDAKDSNGNTALHVAAGNFNKQKFKSFKLFYTVYYKKVLQHKSTNKISMYLIK